MTMQYHPIPVIWQRNLAVEYCHLLHDLPRLCIEDSHFRELETFIAASFASNKKRTFCLSGRQLPCCIVCIITLQPTPAWTPCIVAV